MFRQYEYPQYHNASPPPVSLALVSRIPVVL